MCYFSFHPIFFMFPCFFLIVCCVACPHTFILIVLPTSLPPSLPFLSSSLLSSLCELPPFLPPRVLRQWLKAKKVDESVMKPYSLLSLRLESLPPSPCLSLPVSLTVGLISLSVCLVCLPRLPPHGFAPQLTHTLSKASCPSSRPR